jgi:hypothetical protein
MTKTAKISWAQALSWRMQRQMLDPVGKEAAEAVVGRLAAVASSAGELSIRSRQARSQAGEVERAIADGRLIKVYAFRGATHLMTPEDAGVYLALRASIRMWELPSWQSFYKLKPADWPGFRKAVRDALADGPLTWDEFKADITSHRQFKHLSKTFTDTLMKPLTWQGDMSFGPPRDGQSTFQRLEGNPRWGGIPDVEVAGPKAIEAYLAVYGPATLKHLRYWIGEGLGAGKQLRAWFAGLKERLAEVDMEDGKAFMLREDVTGMMATPVSSAVRLLPAYDQWVMGPGTFDANVVPAQLRTEVSRGANIVVAGGRVAGTWWIVETTLKIAWAEKRKAPKDQLAEEAERLARFVEKPLTMKFK